MNYLMEIVKLGKGRLGEKPLDYRINIAPDLPDTIYGDHANLKKVVINLLTNAIKYTDTGCVDFRQDHIFFVDEIKYNKVKKLIYHIMNRY